VSQGQLSLESTDRGNVVLAYPHDYPLETVCGKLSVLDSGDKAVLAAGRPVEIGGALLDVESAARILTAEDRELCRSPFFWCCHSQPESCYLKPKTALRSAF
jgi:hypothetical protein